MDWKQLKNIRSLALPTRMPGLHHRSDLHLTRKCFHMQGAFLILFPYLYFHISRDFMAAVLGTLLAFAMSVEYARMRWEWINTLVVKIFGSILRDTEVKQLSGIPFYIASSLFAFLIFPHHIAVLSILYLALGDPSSSFFGVLYGQNKLFPNKSLQGTLGGFCICTLVTFVYFLATNLAPEKIIIMSLIGGFAGSIAELLPLNIDDNFAIPVVSGFIMYIAFLAATIPV